MSKYYNVPRTRNLFEPNSKKPYKLSRSMIDLFLECPRCFYFDRRKGVGRPPGFPFTINSAIDGLLKKEFDIYRREQAVPPLLRENGIDAIPYQHENIESWRDSLNAGIQFLHEPTNILVCGGIDDVWINPNKELVIADYKATAKKDEVNLDADWQIGYKRQMEVYQWLFRKNDFKVSDTGYFVYCNANMTGDRFDGQLSFKISVIPYSGSDGWVEKAVCDAHACLCSDLTPEMNGDCDYCRYREAIRNME